VTKNPNPERGKRGGIRPQAKTQTISKNGRVKEKFEGPNGRPESGDPRGHAHSDWGGLKKAEQSAVSRAVRGTGKKQAVPCKRMTRSLTKSSMGCRGFSERHCREGRAQQR